MQPRTCYFEGLTVVSPEFKQQGKPFQINAEIKQKWLETLPTNKTLKQKISALFDGSAFVQFEKANFNRGMNKLSKNQNALFTEAENLDEDNEMDDLFMLSPEE